MVRAQVQKVDARTRRDGQGAEEEGRQRFFYPKALESLRGAPPSVEVDRKRETAIGPNAQVDPANKPKEILEAWRWYKGEKICAWVHIETRTLLRAVPTPTATDSGPS